MTIIDKLDRAHRMSCSDASDTERVTLYSEARDALIAAQPRVLSVAETMAADPTLDQVDARDAVAAILDQLPNGTLVQVVDVNDRRPDWVIRQASYYERGGRWTLLDPSDRDDGEVSYESGQVAAASIYYGAKGHANGFIRVLFVPEPEDQ